MTAEPLSAPLRAKPSRAAWLALAAILLVSTFRIVSTYQVFSQTYDESAHIAAGMEWLVEGTYTAEPQHPPLARIFTAVGPRLAGASLPPRLPLPQQGNAILHSGPYLKMLSLARAGILPFFLLSIVAVWLYALRLGGEVAAVAAALLYANLPPVLAHAGLATTDMAVTAGVICSVFLLHSWLEEPTPTRAALLGLAVAMAFVSKFSSGLFITVAGAVTIITVLASGQTRGHRTMRPVLRHGMIVIVMFAAATLATYRFSVHPLEGANRAFVHELLQGNALYEAAASILYDIPLPAPEIAGGLAQMLLHNESGHQSYLLGEHKIGGWWYYFPTAIAVKTTLVFLLGSVAATLIGFRLMGRRRGLLVMAPLLSAIAIVISSLPVDINIGIRHVLAIYPLMAVSIGVVIALLWKCGRTAKLMISALVIIELGASTSAHPDYLPYFNILAGREPHRILIDSNLDWGQDLLRLARRSRALGIDGLRLSYFGTADLTKHDLPRLLQVTYDKPSPGWFAVSEGNIGSTTYPVTFPWLDQYQPVERIGKSIRLYRIPDLEPLLVPLRLGTTPGGSRIWTSELLLENQSDRIVKITDGAGRALTMAPRSTSPWNETSESPAPLLYVAPDDVPAISGRVIVSSSGVGTAPRRDMEIPIVPLRDLPRGPLRLTVPGCEDCRRMLRVFDLSQQKSSVSVSALVSGELRRQRLAPAYFELPGREAAYAQSGLEALFPPLRGNQAVEIILSSDADPSHRLWAFVTITTPDGSELIMPQPREASRPQPADGARLGTRARQDVRRPSQGPGTPGARIRSLQETPP